MFVLTNTVAPEYHEILTVHYMGPRIVGPVLILKGCRLLVPVYSMLWYYV